VRDQRLGAEIHHVRESINCTISPIRLASPALWRNWTRRSSCSTRALLVALEGRKPHWWALYGLAVSAAVYTHYIAALTLFPQAAWALWTNRESLREQLVTSALVVLAFLTWLSSFIDHRVAARFGAVDDLEWAHPEPGCTHHGGAPADRPQTDHVDQRDGRDASEK
jgi:hypothetical protein